MEHLSRARDDNPRQRLIRLDYHWKTCSSRCVPHWYLIGSVLRAFAAMVFDTRIGLIRNPRSVTITIN